MIKNETSNEYLARIDQQLVQYESVENIHDLPNAFHHWSHNYLRPALAEVFGVASVAEFYANGFMSASNGVARPRFLSIGSGDGWLEIEISRQLRSNGLEFEFVAADIAPIMLDRFRAAMPEDLKGYLFPVENDLNAISIDGRFTGVMANHSLHHFVELEHIFDFIRDRLDGVFITNDMIGRNGHMRWPETLAVTRGFWPLLLDHQKVNVQLQRVEGRYINHDCSSEGFEGIRAQDILRLLVERFNVDRFVSAGGFIDVFVDRGFGHNFRMDDNRDANTIEALCRINDMMLDADMIKPTIMFGYFSNSKKPTIFYRDRTPARAMREPNQVVSWSDYYDSQD